MSAPGNAEYVAQQLGSAHRSGSGWKCLCPAHNDHNPSLSVSDGDNGLLLVNCKAHCSQGNVINALRNRGLWCDDVQPPRQIQAHRANGHAKVSSGRIIAEYDYRDETGELVFQVLRKEPKGPFPQRRPDGNGGWIWDLKGVPRVPYCLPDLIAADPAAIVFIPEGEKDVENLCAIGLVATCNPGGAGKWDKRYNGHLRGRRVVVLPDNDPQKTKPDGTPEFHADGRPVLPGQDHAADVAASLRGTAASVHVLMLPGLPLKGDVSDWIAEGGTADELLGMAAELQREAEAAARSITTVMQEPNTLRARAETTELPLGEVEATEDAVARAFAERYAGEFVFDHTAMAWFIWRSGRWTLDNRSAVWNAAREFTRTVRNRLDEPNATLAKVSFTNAVERASRADPKLAVSQEIWDTDAWLLGTPDGVVDLRTGDILPPDPSRYISRHTSVAPAPPGTPAPLWLAFLKSALKGDAATQSFIKRLSGYMLTGDVTEEMLTFLYGSGGNGKGVLLTVLLGILGEYAVSVPIEVFTADSHINREYYRAQMAGARLVTASETKSQATWAESQIKELTGNEAPLSARQPYGKPFTFHPQFKLLLVGNHAPKLKGRTPAMERRLRIVPMNHTPENPDPDLKEKLKAEYPAILRWMLDGCAEWQRDRLGTSEAIKGATAAYFERQDAFRHWLDERCTLDARKKQKFGLLLANFNEWAKANGEETLSQNAFSELIDRTPPLFRKRANDGSWVIGIDLKPAMDEGNPWQ